MGGVKSSGETRPSKKVTPQREASRPIRAHAAGLLHEGAAARWRIDDELDLRFLFSDAPRAAGLRSNLGPQLEALAAGLGRRGVVQAAVSDDAMVARLDSAFRAARVGRVLRAVAPEHAAVLQGAYDLAAALSPPVVARYGAELAGVVRVLFPAGDDAQRADEARALARCALSRAQGAYAAARLAARPVKGRP
jgi:hypothetical protein